MPDQDRIPQIQGCFRNDNNQESSFFYEKMVRSILNKRLPPDFVLTKFTPDQLSALLPFFTSTPCESTPGKMSFYMFAKFRSNSFKFFFEMISGWLVPGKRLNVALIYAADFKMANFGDNIYTLCEITIEVENSEELKQILANLPTIETEIKQGLESSYYARRILEIKGLMPDEKTIMIQEHIAYLVKRLPQAFGLDILTEMQHVLVICHDEFKTNRESRHLSRIISVHYLFRKSLYEAIKENPEKRHVSIKFFKSNINVSSNRKSVLSVMVGINFIRENEIFEKKHLLLAIQSSIPSAQSIEGSFFSTRRASENVCTLYLEIEKNDGLEFTSQELKTLRQKLSGDLKDRVEHFIHPVFMPRNEEEIMRNIITLSGQIKQLSDVPQVIISFDEQTHEHLSFTIIVVRVLMPGSPSIQELFNKSNSFLEYIYDRCKMVGFLRKKITKEATVFRVRFLKNYFLRHDHSIDLYKARQAIASELLSIIGEYRDFNGGMITKQTELLNALKELIPKETKYSDIILENFFFSLMPVAMRTLLEPEALKTLFLMLLDAIDHGFASNEGISIKREIDFMFILIKIETLEQKEKISEALNEFTLQSTQLAYTSVKVHGILYGGYIYRSDNPHKQQQFLQVILGT